MKVSSQQLLQYLKDYENFLKNVTNEDLAVEALAFLTSLKLIIRKFDKVNSKIPGGSGKSVIDWAFNTSCYDDLDLYGDSFAAKYLKQFVFDNTEFNKYINYVKKINSKLNNSGESEEFIVNYILRILLGMYTLIILAIQANLGDLTAYDDNENFKKLCKSFQKYTKNLEDSDRNPTDAKIQDSREFKSLLIYNKSLKSARI